MELAYKHERPLFTIALVISVFFWLILLVSTFGLLLVYILFGWLFLVFAHSAFITYMKGSGVRITEAQYPDLHQKLLKCCDTVGVGTIPEAYILRTDFFNALATRFLGRHYIVLFSDVLDALEEQPDAIDFYIGHELGHIHRKHLLWGWVVAPACILPILGTALRRAEEYTCDRYGAACCATEEDVTVALAAIAAGDTRWKSLNRDAYLEQVGITSDFWMSFNELINDYPWLCKRMFAALSFHRKETINFPSRHPLAWVLSCFIPRFGAGGLMSLIMLIAIIGILAAIAIPAYQDYTLRAKHVTALNAATPAQHGVMHYVMDNREWPTSLTQIGFDQETIEDPSGAYSISLYEGGVIGILVGENELGQQQYILLEPVYEGEEFEWICGSQGMKPSSLPARCR